MSYITEYGAMEILWRCGELSILHLFVTIAFSNFCRPQVELEFSKQPLTRLMAHPVTHENVHGSVAMIGVGIGF